METCWKCSGSGSVQWGVCFQCHGTGKTKAMPATEMRPWTLEEVEREWQDALQYNIAMARSITNDEEADEADRLMDQYEADMIQELKGVA